MTIFMELQVLMISTTPTLQVIANLDVAQWKCVTQAPGGQFVMMTGIMLMHPSFALN